MYSWYLAGLGLPRIVLMHYSRQLCTGYVSMALPREKKDRTTDYGCTRYEFAKCILELPHCEYRYSPNISLHQYVCMYVYSL